MAETQLRTLSGQVGIVAGTDVAALRDRLRGTLVGPEDPGYDDARAVWNGLVDRRPGLVLRCAGTADVILAVTFAREHDLVVTVRGGGHNTGGSAVADDALMIDLSAMKGVRVDPGRRTVRAEGGVTVGELDHETQAFGLAVPMGVISRIGIAGLTLGGGFGWLRRRYGLCCDNLVGADVVTSAGTLVRAGTDGDADLLWGLRGGGGNFGVVTSFDFQAHPVGPDVYFAYVLHRGEDARAALRFYRDWARGAPDEVAAIATLWHNPEQDEVPEAEQGRPGLAFMAMHCGDPAAGAEALRGLRDFGAPLADLSAVQPYLAAQRLFDADYAAGEMRGYWKSRYLDALTDEAVDAIVTLNEASPSTQSNLDVWQLGGRYARFTPDDAAYGDRSAAYLIGIEGKWTDPGVDGDGIAWGRRVFDVLAPFSTRAEYVNFPGLYEDNPALVRAAFGGNLDRLRALKKRYDPDNMFRFNHNIPPD
ncbi:FAD-binding oxidoreductase [Micromonospora phytophila]|uniref:FAD-binding oxidoreductase n=1 Tax=Micromonospora phytophila TaxID=709888 RepID=UPI00202FC1DF|nr:FAD-binding oxidoreductase [Micromonospora phytophila]MCM0673843.1 FAD-binding oxidoreductase [Micromonospora phytophila]